MLSHLNMYPTKTLAGIVAGFVSVLCENLLPLFVAVIIFEVMDFLTGCIKSAVISKRKGERFAFESIKAWRTIYKFVFILIGIVLAELLDQTFGNESRLKLANYFTAFCCGVEFWSFLENAAVISDHPIFRMLKKVMREKVEDQIKTTFEDEAGS